MTWDELRQQILKDHLPHPRHTIDERTEAGARGGWELNDSAARDRFAAEKQGREGLKGRLGLGKSISSVFSLLTTPAGAVR